MTSAIRNKNAISVAPLLLQRMGNKGRGLAELSYKPLSLNDYVPRRFSGFRRRTGKLAGKLFRWAESSTVAPAQRDDGVRFA